MLDQQPMTGLNLNRQIHFVAKLSLMILILMGCSNLGNSSPEVESAELGYNDFRMQLFANQKHVKVNEPVTITLNVKNVGKRVAVIESRDTPILDISAGELGGGKIYAHWSLSHPDLVEHRLELAPGESRSIQLTWTLQPEDRHISAVAGVSGALYEKSKEVQSVSVLLCIEYCR